jgi:hypothetical protein
LHDTPASKTWPFFPLTNLCNSNSLTSFLILQFSITNTNSHHTTNISHILNIYVIFKGRSTTQLHVGTIIQETLQQQKASVPLSRIFIFVLLHKVCFLTVSSIKQEMSVSGVPGDSDNVFSSWCRFSGWMICFITASLPLIKTLISDGCIKYCYVQNTEQLCNLTVSE